MGFCVVENQQTKSEGDSDAGDNPKGLVEAEI